MSHNIDHNNWLNDIDLRWYKILRESLVSLRFITPLVIIIIFVLTDFPRINKLSFKCYYRPLNYSYGKIQEISVSPPKGLFTSITFLPRIEKIRGIMCVNSINFCKIYSIILILPNSCNRQLFLIFGRMAIKCIFALSKRAN